MALEILHSVLAFLDCYLREEKWGNGIREAAKCTLLRNCPQWLFGWFDALGILAFIEMDPGVGTVMSLLHKEHIAIWFPFLHKADCRERRADCHRVAKLSFWSLILGNSFYDGDLCHPIRWPCHHPSWYLLLPEIALSKAQFFLI